MASENGHVDVVRALLQHNKVDVNLQNCNGSTALDVARTSQHFAIASLLEEHVARVRANKEFSQRPNSATGTSPEADIPHQ
jgi:ankyrin repeat protein